jgi:hypothetical protein
MADRTAARWRWRRSRLAPRASYIPASECEAPGFLTTIRACSKTPVPASLLESFPEWNSEWAKLSG